MTKEGWSIRDLAVKFGVSRSRITKIYDQEYGRRGDYALDVEMYFFLLDLAGIPE